MKKTTHLWFWLAALVPVLLLTFIAGLWVFMSVTATPLHPDAAGIPSAAAAVPAPRWSGAVERARQAARAALVDQNLPGLSVAAGAAGHVVWAEGFGYADLASRTPVRPEMRFRVGDASKAITSIGAGLLLERGALKLDDEIQTYVPEYPRKQWPVTLRQLMGQIGGVTTDQGDEAPMPSCERTIDGLRMFATEPLLFEPGTRFHASNYGWILVSAAVEAAAGQPFFSFMRDRVFDPIGMADTIPDTTGTEAIADRPAFYFPRFAGDTRYGPEVTREGDHSCYAGATGFLSTASDLVRFGLAVGRGSMLAPATVAMLQSPVRLRSGERIDYGLGWKLETLPLAGASSRMAGHGSKPDFIGGTAYLMTFPDRGLAVVVMSNTSFADAKSIALAVAEAFAVEG